MKTTRSFFGSPGKKKLTLAGVVLSTAATMALVAACGDGAGRANGGERDAGNEPDAQANLPEAGEPYDAGPRPDAKDPYFFADEEVVCKSEAGPCVKELVAGQAHFCARMADGTVRCWGKDDSGNLGRRAPKDDPDAGDARAIALPVDGLAGATQISAAANTTCARLGDGTLRCWGSNQNAELGLTVDPATSDWDPHPAPTAPMDVEDVARVDVGHRSVCAVLATGKLTCWGRNSTGQLARPIPEDGFNVGPGAAEIAPIAVEFVRGGSNSTIGMTGSGDLWVWGAISGQDGLNSGIVAALSPSLAPRKIEKLSKVTSFGISLNFQPPITRPPPGVPAGDPPPQQAHACAIANGDVYCWGRSDKAALCTGLPDPERVPRIAPVSTKAWPQRIAVGHEITCVRLTDGTVQCCGGNERGRLGLPATTTHSASFLPVTTFKGHAVQVVTSNASVCALVQGGTVECWGGNLDRELGTAEPDEGDHPETHEIAF